MNVLLIDPNREDREFLQQALSQEKDRDFTLECVDSLQAGLARLAQGGIDLVVSDTALPDSQGHETIERLRTQVLDVPIVVLTNRDDEASALRAVQSGAQDYWVRGDLGRRQVIRSLRLAILRHHMLAQLRALSTIDDLTGLYNRRGFMRLAEQHLKVADRGGRQMMLLLADLDKFKAINDQLGHPAGDMALIETGKVLRETFRTSDLIARLGGDEFAILAVEADRGSARVLARRLQDRLDLWNRKAARKYQLSLSVGIACSRPGTLTSLDQLIAEADRALYDQKRVKMPGEFQMDQLRGE